MKKKNCSLLLTKKLNNKIKPLKKLIIGFQKISGRNNRGKITRYNRGGGHKRYGVNFFTIIYTENLNINNFE